MVVEEAAGQSQTDGYRHCLVLREQRSADRI